MREFSNNNIKNDLSKHGYTIVRNVFSELEMDILIKACHNKCALNNYKDSVSGDVINNVDIRNIIFNANVISIIDSIVNGKEPVYFLDSQIHCKSNRRIFHTDARNYQVNPRVYNYPIYRLGIYMQDHTNFSGGIKFRSNSHRRHILNKLLIKNVLLGKQGLNDPISFLNIGKIINARTKIGDLVIWSLRTQHSGGAVIPKFLPSMAFHPFFDNFIPNVLKKPEHDRRVSVFYTFGEDSIPLSKYIEYKLNNPNDLEHWNNSYIDNSILSFAEERGFSIHEKIIRHFK
jgi:hypothetical protein